MKLLFESWRRYLTEEDETFVFHHATSVKPELFRKLFDPMSSVQFTPRDNDKGTYGPALYGSIPGSSMASVWANKPYIYKIMTSKDRIIDMKQDLIPQLESFGVDRAEEKLLPYLGDLARSINTIRHMARTRHDGARLLQQAQERINKAVEKLKRGDKRKMRKIIEEALGISLRGVIVGGGGGGEVALWDYASIKSENIELIKGGNK